MIESTDPESSSRRRFGATLAAGLGLSLGLPTTRSAPSKPHRLDVLYDQLMATWGPVIEFRDDIKAFMKRHADLGSGVEDDYEEFARLFIEEDRLHPIHHERAAYDALIEGVMAEAGFVDDADWPEDNVYRRWGSAVAIIRTDRRLYVVTPMNCEDLDPNGVGNLQVVAIDLGELA